MNSKKEVAYELLKNKIILNELPPLAEISEKALVEEMGISRTPVHEAIQRLREEHFVNTYPRKGTFVTPITLDVVKSVYEMRYLTEPHLTRSAVSILSKEWLQEMRRKLMDTPKNVSQTEEAIYLANLDTELHSEIVYCSNNIFLQTGLRNVYDHARRHRLRTIRNADQIKMSQKEHIALVDALLAEDADRAEQIAQEHILHSRELTYATLGLAPQWVEW